MSKVEAAVAVTVLEDENPLGEVIERPGVRAVCSQCGLETTSFGTGEDSRRRCLAMLREDCLLGESNWYVEEE